MRSALARLAPIDRNLRERGMVLVAAGLGGLARHDGSYGVLSRSWPTGSMVVWVAVMLGLSLVLYYISTALCYVFARLLTSTGSDARRNIGP